MRWSWLPWYKCYSYCMSFLKTPQPFRTSPNSAHGFFFHQGWKMPPPAVMLLGDLLPWWKTLGNFVKKHAIVQVLCQKKGGFGTTRCHVWLIAFPDLTACFLWESLGSGRCILIKVTQVGSCVFFKREGRHDETFWHFFCLLEHVQRFSIFLVSLVGIVGDCILGNWGWFGW